MNTRKQAQRRSYNTITRLPSWRDEPAPHPDFSKACRWFVIGMAIAVTVLCIAALFTQGFTH